MIIKPRLWLSGFRLNSVCYDVKLYNGYRLFAMDGSTMTYNGSPDDGTYVPKSGKGVNQFHVNAMYDLLNRVYADIIVQPKPHTNEPVIFVPESLYVYP